MRELILDAGPLIALFSAKDSDHLICRAGFEQLNRTRTALLVPLPMIFEVHKWLLYNQSTIVAQNTLKAMQNSLHAIPIGQSGFERICLMMQGLSQWRGSLEDATVIILAQRYRCPVWTLNYRDFGMFKSLEFWNLS